MAKPWGGAGAWAAEAEQAEADAKAAGHNNSLPAESFPSLGDTMSGSKTTKKKKAMTFSISEFTVGKYVGPGGKQREMNDNRGLSAKEMMLLPTGPRDRSNEEPESGAGTLGGGFRDYGGFRGGDRGGDRLGGGDRDDRSRDRGGFGGGFDRERGERGGGDRMGRDRDRDEYPRDDGPSRADEAGSWGANKKALPAATGGGYQASGAREERMGRGGYEDDTRERGRMSDRDLPSRADEVDNWGSTKKFVPSAPADSFDRRGPPRGGGGGGGFEDAPRRGGGGFDDAPGGISRADEVDNWGAAKKFVPTTAPPERRGSGGGGFESTYRDAGSEADRWSRREPPPATDDVVRPAERPRLVLKPRSVPQESPLPPLPADRNGENERPLSSHSTRSDRSVSVAGDETAPDQPVAKPKPRSNPFGAARPREEVLAEKGQDWRKIDAELEVKRPSSSHSNRSSRPQTPEVGSGGEGVPRSRPKVNPFGDARPRDASAERVNRDWRKPAADVVVVDSSTAETEESDPALEEDSTDTTQVVS